MRRIELHESIALPADGIIKSDLFSSLARVADMEEVARQRAASLIDNGRAEVENLRRIARAEGYAEGLKAFVVATMELSHARRRLHERIEGLLRDCLQRVLCQLPKEQLLEPTLAAVLSGFRETLHVSIMVHPDNYGAVDRAIEVYRSTFDTPAFLRLDVNPSMSIDECLVYAGPEVIDISVTVIIEEMLAALRVSEGKVNHNAK